MREDWNLCSKKFTINVSIMKFKDKPFLSCVFLFLDAKTDSPEIMPEANVLTKFDQLVREGMHLIQ